MLRITVTDDSSPVSIQAFHECETGMIAFICMSCRMRTALPAWAVDHYAPMGDVTFRHICRKRFDLARKGFNGKGFNGIRTDERISASVTASA